MLASVVMVKKVSFGQWLEFNRRVARLSQQKVADALGVSRQTISNWECDRYVPEITPTQTKMLCDRLEVTFDQLEEAFRGEATI